MSGASQILLTQGDAPLSVPSGKSSLFVGTDGGLRTKDAAGNVIILENYAAMPSHYNRDVCWAAKGNATAADRITLLSPNRMTVNVDDKGFALSEQIEMDLSSAANWDPTSATDYTQAANRAGKNFYIYECANDGELVHLLSANSTSPGNYTADTSRKVGGFPCLCVAVGTISGHTLSGYLAGDILPAGIWDLKHRPVSAPEGMVYVSDIGKWVDIYLASVSSGALVSVYGGIIADGTSSPAFDWYDFVEWLGRIGKRLPTQDEFMALSDGAPQGTNISGSSDPETTGGHYDTSNVRDVSKHGVEDPVGVEWHWLREAGGPYNTTASNIDQYTARTSQRGQGYYVPNRGLAGGYWADAARCGSRGSLWNASPLALNANVGARGVAEPLAVAL